MKKSLIVIILALILVTPLVSSAAGFVPCGGKGESACTLCHLFVMAQGLWSYATYILGIIAVTMIIISGLIYLVSGASENLNKIAKEAMTNVFIGLLIVLGAWLIVNTAIYLLAVKGSGDDWDLQGTWYKLECSTTSNQTETSK